MRSDYRIGVAIIAVSSLLWGTTGTAATFAPGVGPLAVGAAAFSIGGVLQAVFASRGLALATGALRTNWRMVLTGAGAVLIYPLAFYTSMHLAGVASGTVVSLASAPVAAGLLERLTGGRPLARRWMLAAGLGAVGAMLLCVSPTGASVSSMTSTLLGVGLGLVAGLTYATYSWAAHALMQAGVGRAASMGAVFGLGGLLLVPILLVTGAPLLASSRAVLVIAYVALVSVFLGYLLFGFGLMRVTAATATTVTMLEPAVAAVLAVVVVGERLSTLGWTGLGLVAAVLVILSTATAKPSDMPEDHAVRLTIADRTAAR